jgi:calmodulin-regulated spectrin-associated protein
LGNASIYCQVLANIYSDPNYQSLNHWTILQTLCRKGVPILEERPGEAPLTETVLIQTNPIRIVSINFLICFLITNFIFRTLICL